MNESNVDDRKTRPMKNNHCAQPREMQSPLPDIAGEKHRNGPTEPPEKVIEPAIVGETSAGILDVRDLQLAQMTAKLAESEQQHKDLQLRHLAEKQNLQRRSEQAIDKAYKFSLEKLVRDLLPILDSLERAVALAERENDAALPMIEGLDLTLKSFNDTMHKFGIEAVGEPGIPFDPERHQAMTLVETELQPPNHIVTVMQKGYTLNGRLLRAAIVTVARAVEE